VSRLEGGGRPVYTTVEDAEAEAGFVVASVLARREEGLRLRDQAVLFRSSHHADRLELELTRRNIPYVKYGGLKFLEAAHVKDLMAVLKWADNPRNDVAAFRVLKLLPGMGPARARNAGRHLELAGFRWASLRSWVPPEAARDEWPAFCDLMETLGGAEPQLPDWQWQLERLRSWYRPQLERLYESAEVRDADLEQLERIASGYATRERFLTGLTLDPPAAWRATRCSTRITSFCRPCTVPRARNGTLSTF